MSKTVKNLLVAFTVVCAFTFAVFLIQLLVLNSGSAGNAGSTGNPGNAGSTPVTSGTPPAESETPPSWQPTSSGNTKPDGENSPDGAEPSDNTGQEGAQQEPDGTWYGFEMPEGLELAFFVKEEIREQQFSYIEPESDLEAELGALRYNGNGTAALELRYVFLRGTVAEYAEDSLDKYVGAGGTTVVGDSPIKNSGLRGTAVAGTYERLTFEGWIYDFSSYGVSNVGVEIIVYYQNPLQQNALYDILDSMTIGSA